MFDRIVSFNPVDHLDHQEGDMKISDHPATKEKVKTNDQKGLKKGFKLIDISAFRESRSGNGVSGKGRPF
jgi:hypothetical protein